MKPAIREEEPQAWKDGENEKVEEKEEDKPSVGEEKQAVLRLLTQNMNIHHFVGHSYPNREARVLGLLEHLEQYDVVMLQELFKFHMPWGASGAWRDRIIAKWPHHHQASHDPPSWFQQDTGLLILSKYPIVEAKTISFEQRSLAEIVSLKGALMAKLKIKDEDKPLIIITAHLDAHSFEIRLAQLKQVMVELVLKELEADSGARILFGGDLNVDSIHHKEAWEATKSILHPLKNVIEEGAYESDNSEAQFPITHHLYHVCLDHVFFHGVDVAPASLRVEKWPSKAGASGAAAGRSKELISDHYGISLSFDL